MRSYSLVAPAKINLYLQIVGDRPDGFHELVMVLQSIELADFVTVRAIGTDQIRVHCDNPAVPVDQTNLAYRAAELMMQEFPEMAARFGGVEIDLQKRIPMGAGLAGGSSNAAAVLVGIDLMWNLGLTQWELQELSARLGSDIPFCISGGTALATGRGEQLAPLTSLDKLYVVLAKYRDLPVSTPWAYKTYRQKFGDSYPKSLPEIEAKKARSREMLNAIAHHDFKQIGQHLYNDLELVVLPEFEKIQQIRDQFAKFNPIGTMMSGSGSTVFALAESRSQAEEMRHQMRSAIPDPDLELWVTKLSQCGVHLANS
jgi:4-diphosphocytidyl-2-C-methyl-D-erythritol kinase